MIEIQILGNVASGKSTLLRYIKECLEKADLLVEVKTFDEPQLQIDQSLVFQRSEELQNKCLHSIKEVITISEIQINRLSLKDVKLTKSDIEELNRPASIKIISNEQM